MCVFACQEANNPEAVRQLTEQHTEKMASLLSSIEQQLRSQQQTVYSAVASEEYIRNKSQLCSQQAKVNNNYYMFIMHKDNNAVMYVGTVVTECLVYSGSLVGGCCVVQCGGWLGLPIWLLLPPGWPRPAPASAAAPAAAGGGLRTAGGRR